MALKIYKKGAYVVINNSGKLTELNSAEVSINKDIDTIDIYEVKHNGVSVLKAQLSEILDESGVAYVEAVWDAFRYEQTGTTNTGTGVTSAAGVTYDNATSGLTATDLQDAIDEVDSTTEKVKTATATAAGLTTGALTGSNQFVTVTSAAATDVICLPIDASTPVGTVIRGWVGANGFELRPIASEAATATINGVTTSVEAAIPASTLFKVEKVAALTWILTATDELGATITAIIPDAI